MRIDKHFLDTIPKEKKVQVCAKINQFESDLHKYKSFLNMPHGYYIRNIAGTDIYKFRINDGDRILYKFDEDKSRPIFLEYCKHDVQVREAKFSEYNLENSVEYDPNNEVEDIIDNKIDDIVRSKYYKEYLNNLCEFELDDETITLGAASDNLEDKKYLTIEQFQCIEEIGKPILILGCAGSGKTLIGIKKLYFADKLNINSAYISQNSILVDSTKSLYKKMVKRSSSVNFFTLNELCAEILKIDKRYIMTFANFKLWLLGKNIYKKHEINLTPIELWNEIENVLKGRHDVINILNKEKYLACNESNIDIEIRRVVYNIAIDYNEWIKKSEFVDINDLINEIMFMDRKGLFDAIVYDEVQELNDKALSFLKWLCPNNDIVLLGDYNQRLNLSIDNYLSIKSEIDNNICLKLLNKNYRNGLGIVKWINQFKTNITRKSYNSTFHRLLENAIKDGENPYIMCDFKSINELFEKVSKNTNSIIIVNNDETKNLLNDKGINVSRTFTIEECRGLQYKNIYCFNILDELNKGKYNSIYISVTRAISKLYFVEEKNDDFENYVKENTITVNEDELLYSIEEEKNKSTWLDEAVKLEKMEKYEQASYAYRKAGCYYEEKQCKMAEEKNVSFFKLKNNGIYIDIYADNLSIKNITLVLEQLYLKYKLKSESWIEMYTYHIGENFPKKYYVYIDKDCSYSGIGNLLFNEINFKIMSNKHITLNLYNMPRIQSDIHVYIRENSIIFTESYCHNFRGYKNIKENADQRDLIYYGIHGKTQIQYIRDEKKVKNQTSENILNEIFGGNKN